MCIGFIYSFIYKMQVSEYMSGISNNGILICLRTSDNSFCHPLKNMFSTPPTTSSHDTSPFSPFVQQRRHQA